MALQVDLDGHAHVQMDLPPPSHQSPLRALLPRPRRHVEAVRQHAAAVAVRHAPLRQIPLSEGGHVAAVAAVEAERAVFGGDEDLEHDLLRVPDVQVGEDAEVGRGHRRDASLLDHEAGVVLRLEVRVLRHHLHPAHTFVCFGF